MHFEDPAHKLKCTLRAVQGDHVGLCPLNVLLEVAQSNERFVHLVPILRKQVGAWANPHCLHSADC